MTTLVQGTALESGEDIAVIQTIRRGIAVSPELTEGIRGTLALAVVASVGQVIVPIVVQQTIDHGLNGIAYPADGAIAYARSRGLEPKLYEYCCSLTWTGDEGEVWSELTLPGDAPVPPGFPR